MLLIAAALSEEIKTALDLCRTRTKVSYGDMRIWSGTYRGRTIAFLKTGVGPVRAARKLDSLLKSFHPRRMLIIGYAGALSPELKVADLIVLRRTSAFGEKEVKRRPLDHLEADAGIELYGSSELVSIGRDAGLQVHCGVGLTSPLIIGSPQQKRVLYQKFKTLAVDMETAALARVAQAGRIAAGCVRAVSDEADDDFLAPFTYDPEASSVDRAVRVLGAGNWRNRLQAWRERSMKARGKLKGFLRCCFEAWTKPGAEDSWLE